MGGGITSYPNFKYFQQTVHTLISRARAQLNVSSGSQRIIFGGRVLHAAQTVQGAGITNGQTVHLVDRGPSA